MKKILSIAVLASILCAAVSCEKEALEPTNIEKDWSKNIDLSNSYVKQLFEQTGVAILTEFNDTTDVFYQGSDYGVASGFKIKHLADADKDKAIEWLKTNILDCFSTECIKNYFPKRIFLCKQLDAPGTLPTFTGAWIQELRYVNNLWSATGAQHIYPFAQGIAISVNPDLLFNTETQIDYNTEYRVDQMALLCDELFMNNDWLEGIKENVDIFPEKLTELYGRNVGDQFTTLNGIKYVPSGKEGMWRKWYGCNVTDSKNGDEIAKWDNTKMNLHNYFKFGFPETGQSENMAYNSSAFRWTPYSGTSKNYDDYANTGVAVSIECDGYASLSSTYGTTAPRGIYRDSRNLILALADLNSTKLTFYSDFLIERLWTMSEYLRSYGIDFRKFNASVTEMYKMHDELSK